MVKIIIDGEELEVEAGMTVLQACEQADIEIPRFCYHEKLSIAGNCRMCLVEVKPGNPKPQASCALPIAEGMEITTRSETVKAARRGVLEFLLINHPLDCPICDQGGECDLQDQTMAYGPNSSRFKENKRAVSEKYMGPLIKTVMNRCIHCSRCVRFASEIGGVDEIGIINRGEDAEITSLEQMIHSELSANVIDLCPVGALTSRPYAFKARSWELKKTETIDVSDAVGSNIRLDSRANEVLRILPRLNEDVNEEWISDKTRYFYDGLTRQRLDRPWLRNKKGKLEATDWQEAFSVIAKQFKMTKAEKIAAIAGDLCDIESVFALKDLLQKLGTPHMDCRQDGATIDPHCRAGYLFNSQIAGIEESDMILLIGTNPRKEAATLNARIRKAWRENNSQIFVIGPENDLHYPYTHLGDNAKLIEKIAKGTHPLAKKLAKATRPMLILGASLLSRNDGAQLHAACRQIAETTGMIKDHWNGFNMLHHAAGRVGALDVGFVPQEKGYGIRDILKCAASGSLSLVWLLGADEINIEALEKPFVIYQGHHGDKSAHAADLILPGAAFSEKDALWVNTEGRVQAGWRSVFPPGEAREDWAIIRQISEIVGHPQSWNTQQQLRTALFERVPHLANMNAITPAPWGEFGQKGDIAPSPLDLPITNFYMTDPISRASPTMAECVKRLKQEEKHV